MMSDKQTMEAPKPVTRERELTIVKRYLHFPVSNAGKRENRQHVAVLVAGATVREFEVDMSDQPDWFAHLDVGAWRGNKAVVRVERLPEDSKALDLVAQADAIRDADRLYKEPLRPQFHFSAGRGWLNDPNGLVFYRGEYHLFFQHSPFSWRGTAKYWGQATSRDLVHWTEHGEALEPDKLGQMYSGSAVVDWNNTSGFGKEGRPPLALIYTAAGDPFTQCIAFSNDGREFTKYAGNPVVANITPGNRDPRVFWHEPTRRWVMALYVGKENRHTIHFFTSPNLREWTLASVIAGGGDKDHFLYECPDIFQLSGKWILTAADSDYMVGEFDGKTFTPETPRLKGHQGRGFYAAQTFSHEPKGRVVQIGWLQAATPGMPFNQAMSLPMELKLRATAGGPRLTWEPVEELKALRAASYRGDAVADCRGELLEIRAEFEPADVTFTVRGATVGYDAAKQEVFVNDHRAPAPPADGRQRLIIYADRTSIEVFAADGLIYAPMPFTPKPEDVSIAVNAGSAKFLALEAHQLHSIWEPRP